MTAANDAVIYVDSDSRLQQLITDLRDHMVVAIDTEFIRERTYYPELCLMQIAAGDRIWCVDPLAIAELTDLFQVLFDDSRIKVLHAARQDLEIIFNLTGTVPRTLFDTQIAAALLGRPDQIGYAGLVAEFYDIALDKTSSRTNWARRPLSDAQLDYAADDVRYLEGVKQRLDQELYEAGRETWLEEECERLQASELYANDPATAWLRIKAIHKLDRGALGIAARLAAWRETSAQVRNLPRGWIFKDEILLALARVAPQTKSALGEFNGLSPGLIRRHAAELLELINTDAGAGRIVNPMPAPQLTKEGKALLAELQRNLQRCATESRISQTLIATRRELEQAVAGEQNLRLYQGWRNTLFGSQTRDRIEGCGRTSLHA